MVFINVLDIVIIKTLQSFLADNYLITVASFHIEVFYCWKD